MRESRQDLSRKVGMISREQESWMPSKLLYELQQDWQVKTLRRMEE